MHGSGGTIHTVVARDTIAGASPGACHDRKQFDEFTPSEGFQVL